MRAADCFRQDLSEPRCSDMAENINFHFDVDGENFSSAGEASIEVKKRLRQLGFGAGMGLPNMKKYTDRMDIDSKVGIGTKITMTVKI